MLTLWYFSTSSTIALIHNGISGVHLPQINRGIIKTMICRFPGQNLGELLLSYHEGEVKMLHCAPRIIIWCHQWHPWYAIVHMGQCMLFFSSKTSTCKCSNLRTQYYCKFGTHVFQIMSGNPLRNFHLMQQAESKWSRCTAKPLQKIDSDRVGLNGLS